MASRPTCRLWAWRLAASIAPLRLPTTKDARVEARSGTWNQSAVAGPLERTVEVIVR